MNCAFGIGKRLGTSSKFQILNSTFKIYGELAMLSTDATSSFPSIARAATGDGGPGAPGAVVGPDIPAPEVPPTTPQAVARC